MTPTRLLGLPAFLRDPDHQYMDLAGKDPINTVLGPEPLVWAVQSRATDSDLRKGSSLATVDWLFMV